jgi:type VI secretion system protein ImpC
MNSTANPAAGQAAEVQTKEVSLLDSIVAEGRFGREPSQQERGKDMVKEFINQVLQGQMTLSRDAEQTIINRIADIDKLVSKQLNEVLHYEAFQKLEATWRGVKYLMDQSETSASLKIKLFNAPKKDLLKDLQRAPEFDRSQLFMKVYEEEYGTFGGAPIAALVGDYEFGRGPEDMELLEKVAQVASAAHAP